MKRPIIVEFSGLPNSGKTTLLHNLDLLCKITDVKAIVMQEPAELTPKIIQKGSIEQALWITLETLQSCLEVGSYYDADFILQDRGFYNQMFWAELYESKDAEYSKLIRKFANDIASRYNVKPDYLFVVDVDVEESLKRRTAMGEPVTFSKKDFLVEYRNKFKKFAENIENRLYIDTTGISKENVAKRVFSTILNL